MDNTKNNAVITENKMGTMPVRKLLFNMSLPIIISMLIQALYNVVDSMYVAQIGENALTAVSLVFTMQNLTISIATGIAVGFNALLSRFLGAKNFKKANDVAHHGIVLTLISCVITAAVMFAISAPFMRLQTADAEIYVYGLTYMRICCGICIGTFLQVLTERLLTATGRTMLTMIVQATGAVINIVLDPILIFGLLGAPKLGVAGAAYATIIGQILSAALGFFLNLKYNKELDLRPRRFRLSGRMIKDIFQIGIPSMIMMCIGSVMIFAMNMIFMRLLNSSTAAAVFGVYFKLISMSFRPVFGLNNGLVPIVAYNFGARHKKRIKGTTRTAAAFAITVMVIGMLLFLLIPDKLLLIFNASDNMLKIGVPALRKVCIAFPFAGYGIILSSTLQALGKAVYSMINSLCRQLIVLIPVALILALAFGLDAVWWSLLIAELVSFILMTVFYRKVHRELISPLPD